MKRKRSLVKDFLLFNLLNLLWSLSKPLCPPPVLLYPSERIVGRDYYSFMYYLHLILPYITYKYKISNCYFHVPTTNIIKTYPHYIQTYPHFNVKGLLSELQILFKLTPLSKKLHQIILLYIDYTTLKNTTKLYSVKMTYLTIKSYQRYFTLY